MAKALARLRTGRSGEGARPAEWSNGIGVNVVLRFMWNGLCALLPGWREFDDYCLFGVFPQAAPRPTIAA